MQFILLKEPIELSEGTSLMTLCSAPSSGSSGRVRGGAEKHEIYAAAFGGHLFYDLFLQGRGGHGPLGPLWIRYWRQPKHKYVQST